jgi:hypothetical protein
MTLTQSTSGQKYTSIPYFALRQNWCPVTNHNRKNGVYCDKSQSQKLGAASQGALANIKPLPGRVRSPAFTVLP